MDKLLTIKEASEIMRMHPEGVRRMCRARLIPCRKVGREWRLTEDALKEWMNQAD